MFESVRQHGQAASVATIDIAPLIDVVFILLIFFLVTATFVDDAGLDIERPAAESAAAVGDDVLRIAVSASGRAFIDGRPVTAEDVAAQVRRFAERVPQGAVLVIPDRRLDAGRLVRLIDTARSAGAHRVTIATREPYNE